MDTTFSKMNTAYETLKETLSLSGPMATPQLQKIILSVGIGSIQDKQKVELIADRLIKITGQKPITRGAKQSIAAFKLREGDPVGYQVTLRGERMRDFLDKLIHIALPRMKDFRGISSEAIDEMGNYTLGIREHTIFPETPDEEIKNIFGMAITFVTSAGSKEDAKKLFEHLSFPFKKEQ